MISFTPTVSQLKMLASLRGNLFSVHEPAAVSLALSALELSQRAPSGSSWTNEELSDYYRLRARTAMDKNGIAMIEVRGALMRDCQPIQERVGHTIRYSTITNETNAAISAGAKGIIYLIDSPGGTVSGCAETAEMISNISIPTMAYCDGLACSAAYKLAAGMKGIAASKSAIIGNIGTILSWADCSQFWEKWGVNFKAIVSEHAELKSTFHLEPNEAQLQFLQASVNQAGKEFRDHVTAGRLAVGKSLDSEVWKAGWYSGEKAVELGLADAIGTFDEAYDMFLNSVA